jgi:glutamate dehydrogenase/leucine dehydrogenase
MLPELIYVVSEKKLGFTGHLVIDSTVENKSCGGIRLSSTVTLNEVRSLARNMTLKYGFLGIPTGGAKAGIQIDGTLSINRKRLIFSEFGKSLSRFIKRGFFIPGTDIGTSEEDIAWFMKAAKGQKSGYVKEKSSRGIEYTSWTMISSARQALNSLEENCGLTRQRASLGLEKAAVAIEGFGKIGSSAARAFSESGAKIVGISTSEGAIFNPKGLHVDTLLDLRNKCGDDLVNVYHGAEKIAKNRLLELPVDILLPCAGSYTINSTNANRIRAKVICPGANIPITVQAEQILFKRGIVCLPCFVSNVGAVLGNYMADYISEKKIKEIVDKGFSKTVYELLRLSKERNTYPKKVAIEVAIRRFHEIKRSEGKFPRLFLRAVRSILPGPYPRIVTKSVAQYVFAGRLRRALA